MEDLGMPRWEAGLVDDAISSAQRRRACEADAAERRARQLAREQGYHRLAHAIDRPRAPLPGQLSLLPTEPTLFDEAG
ncbi:hypothetical protein BH18ACT15_BH18ACT15_10470 [soil metagenome]